MLFGYVGIGDFEWSRASHPSGRIGHYQHHWPHDFPVERNRGKETGLSFRKQSDHRRRGIVHRDNRSPIWGPADAALDFSAQGREYDAFRSKRRGDRTAFVFMGTQRRERLDRFHCLRSVRGHIDHFPRPRLGGCQEVFHGVFHRGNGRNRPARSRFKGNHAFHAGKLFRGRSVGWSLGDFHATAFVGETGSGVLR